MSLYFNKYRVESSRLRIWDYSAPGVYFITSNTQRHTSWFGTINSGQMMLNRIGNYANKCWNEIPCHFPNVILDEYIIMPNHVHGLIIITKRISNDVTVETGHAPSLQRENRHMITLSDIVGGFKSAVTRWVHDNNFTQFEWQSRFYDRIIRNERELNNVRKYIIENPLKWNRNSHR